MFIAHKSNVLQTVHEQEWQCRRNSKGLNKSEYWAWIETITDSDGVITYPSETFTIVEVDVTDEAVESRLVQLGDYITYAPVIGTTYNIKWSDAKVDGSHFSGDDTAKDASLLADEWKLIRTERDSLLTSTDWWGASDQTMSDAQTTYRAALRTLPADQSSKTTYASITWPTKP